MNPPKLRKPWYIFVIVGLILCLGTFLRFYQLGNRSLAHDEIGTVVFSGTDKTVGTVVRLASGVHVQPPLSYIIRHFVLFIGHSDFWVRLPEAIYGVLAIAVIYKVTAQLFDRPAGVVAAFLLSISTMHIYYAQEARPYSLMVLLSLPIVYFFYRAVMSNEKWDWVYYTIFALLSVYTNIFGWAMLVVQGLFLSLIYLGQVKALKGKGQRIVESSTIVRFLICVGMVGLLFLPLVPILISESFETFAQFPQSQETISTRRWSLIVKAYQILAAFSVYPLFEPRLIYLSASAFVVGLFFAYKQEKGKALLILFVTIVFTWLVILAFAIGSTTMVKPRYVISSLPWFIIAVSGGVSSLSQTIKRFVHQWSRFKIPAWAISLVLAGSLFGMASLNSIHYVYQLEKQDWRGTATFLAHVAQEDDRIIAWPAMQFLYYYPHAANVLSTEELPLAQLQRELSGHQRVWLVRTFMFRNLFEQNMETERWLGKNNVLTFRFRDEQAAKVGGARKQSHILVSFLTEDRAPESLLEEQAAILTTALKIKPNGWEIHKKLGDILAKQGKTEAAIKEYETVMNLVPEYALLYITLGEMLFKAGRYEEAIIIYQHGVDQLPKNIDLRLGLFQAYQANQQFEEMIAELEQMTEFEATQAKSKTWRKLGDLALEVEALTQAVIFYEKAEVLASDSQP